ncbi:MAG: aminoglycoside N(3)-acetyltransferase [Streptosporangiaceae bacterium]
MAGDPRPPPVRCRGIGREELAAGLRGLGVQLGQHLLIHCSLRSIGPVGGGAATLLDAIREAAGPRSTLVVPAQTTLNSLTARAFMDATAGLDESGRARLVAAMPGFDPALTPSTGMGAFAEYLRTRPAATRSSHPQTSFAALGPGAAACTSVHDLNCHLGERSPLGWLYANDAAILLLGVPYSACTAFHLAEYRLPDARPVKAYHCFTAGPDGREERVFTDIDLDDSDFERLGTAMKETTSFVGHAQVGSGASRLLPLRAAVDFAGTWFQGYRKQVRA